MKEKITCFQRKSAPKHFAPIDPYINEVKIEPATGYSYTITLSYEDNYIVKRHTPEGTVFLMVLLYESIYRHYNLQYPVEAERPLKNTSVQFKTLEAAIEAVHFWFNYEIHEIAELLKKEES